MIRPSKMPRTLFATGDVICGSAFCSPIQANDLKEAIDELKTVLSPFFLSSRVATGRISRPFRSHCLNSRLEID